MKYSLSPSPFYGSIADDHEEEGASSEAFDNVHESTVQSRAVARPTSLWNYLCCRPPLSATPLTGRRRGQREVFVSQRPRDLPLRPALEGVDNSLSLSRVNRRRRVRRMTSHHVMEQRFSARSDGGGASAMASGGSDQLAWVNWLLQQLWPKIDTIVRDKIETEVLPSMRESLGRAIELKEFKLGGNTPTLGPIRTSRRDHGTHESLDVNVHLEYDCDARVAFSVGVLSVGIERVHFKGDLCLSLDPLVDEIPLVGGLQVTLASLLDITWSFSGLANLADMPGISSVVQTAVERTIRETLLLPNCVYIPLRKEEVHPHIEWAYPKPSALLQLSVHQIRGLPRARGPHVELSLGSKLVSTTKGKFKEGGHHLWQPPFSSDFFVYTHNQPVVVRLCGPGGELFGSATIKVRDLLDKDGSSDYWVRIAGEVAVDVRGRLRHLDHVYRPLHSFRQILISIDLYCADSLVEPGSRVRFTLPGATPAVMVSKPGSKREMAVRGDLTCEPRVQRIIEKLREVHRMSVTEVASIAEVEPGVIGQVVEEKPSLSVVWNQALYNLLDTSGLHFNAVKLRVEVLRKGRGFLGRGEIIDFAGDIALRELEACEQMAFRGAVLLHGKNADGNCEIELGVEAQGIEA
ncbi:extended synaptotagmin-like protein [Perkinsus olseni]|uniref:Extended synaptotagmin-like protein n=1 Tax=Perkinsus olseni TaxID=32597 RepID=A0A7J6LJF7_PEROL|nr:extended synaptotagmin-like protein [Perkinsus olseni]